MIKHVVIFVVLIFWGGVWAQAASLEDGFSAYEQGDYTAALTVWRPLAEQGDATAQFNVGQMYRLGKGVTQDDKEAAKWYLLAAQQGSRHARHNLRMMYKEGRISRVDLEQLVGADDDSIVKDVELATATQEDVEAESTEAESAATAISTVTTQEQPKIAAVVTTPDNGTEELPQDTVADKMTEQQQTGATADTAETDKPVETSMPDPTAMVVDKPVDKAMDAEMVDKPVDKAMDAAMIDKPVDKAMDAAMVDKPVDKAMDAAMIDKPVDKAMDAAMVDKPVDKPVDKSMDTAMVDKPVDKPVDKSMDKSMDTAMVDKPVDKPAEQDSSADTIAKVAEPATPVKEAAPGSNWQQQLPGFDAQHYVVQLMAVAGKKNMDRFLAKNRRRLPDDSGYVKTFSKGREWYVLLLGPYSNSSKARTAIKKLPAKISSNEPWLRRVGSLQKILR